MYVAKQAVKRMFSFIVLYCFIVLSVARLSRKKGFLIGNTMHNLFSLLLSWVSFPNNLQQSEGGFLSILVFIAVYM